MTMTFRLEVTMPLPGLEGAARPEPGTPPRRGWDYARRRLVTRPIRWLILKALRALANGQVECYPKVATIREAIAEMGYDPPGEESIRRRLRELEVEDGLIARIQDGRLASRRRIRFTFLAAPKKGAEMSQEGGTRCPRMVGHDVPGWWDTMSHLVVPQTVTHKPVTKTKPAPPNSIPIQTEELTSDEFAPAPARDGETMTGEMTKTLTEELTVHAPMKEELTKTPPRTKTSPAAPPSLGSEAAVTLEDQIALWESQAKLPDWRGRFAREGLERVRKEAEAAAVAPAPITTPEPVASHSPRPSVAPEPAPRQPRPAPAPAVSVPTPGRPAAADRLPAGVSQAFDSVAFAQMSRAKADVPAGTDEAVRLVRAYAADACTVDRVVDALVATFRDRKAKSREFWSSALAEIKTGLLTADLVVGLIRDASRKEVHTHANSFSESLGAALRSARKRSRSARPPAKSHADRPNERTGDQYTTAGRPGS